MKLQFIDKNNPKSLKKRLLFFMILCWFVPIIVFFAFTTSFYRKSIINKTESLLKDEVKNAAAFASVRIEDAINLCQRPSYEKTWENGWKKYEQEFIDRTGFLQEVNSSLRGKFYLDERFDMYAFYLYGEDMPSCYSSRIGTAYSDYVDNIAPGVQEIIALDSNYTYVKVFEGRLFIIRNLYTTTDYKRFGTLVVELNKQKVFQDIPPHVREKIFVCIDEGTASFDFMDKQGDGQGKEFAAAMMSSMEEQPGETFLKSKDSQYFGYLYKFSHEAYHMGLVLLVDKAEMYAGIYELYRIVAVILILFVPVVFYAVYFLRKQIQEPVSKLLSGSKEIEKGNFGVQIAEGNMPNAEFQYLMNSFNSMSAQVAYLFETVYDEKLARKDAQIQALQAQINPHFLNNTLEMMNWQARMNGDTIVSKMIESLGTVLDYRMNRANVKEIHLADELRCTDAYFYIMSMRFGQRLQIEKEIADDLLYLMVPPLILQPIVENAIVHGVERVKSGLIRLQVYHDEEKVYMQVINSGKALREEDLNRIKNILNGEEEAIPNAPGRHTSIGIRNVNKRIQLMYGEGFGLTIEPGEGEKTISTIIVPYHQKTEE